MVSSDQTVRLWDAESGQPIDVLAGHNGPVSAVAWSPNGTLVASGGHDAAVRVWDIRFRRAVKIFRGHTAAIESIVWWPNGNLLTVADHFGLVRVWPLDDAHWLNSFVMFQNLQTLATTADGHYRCTPRIERELRYIVQTDQGQETLMPNEFATKHGWKNEPERALLNVP